MEESCLWENKTNTVLAVESMTHNSKTPENNPEKISQDHLPDKTHPLPFDCIYRGEGNANIVIALQKERKVIRFRKADSGECFPDDGFSRVNREREFIRIVVSRFLQPYLDVPEIVRYDRSKLAAFLETIHSLRPEHRRSKTVVQEYATKFPDHAFLPKLLNCKEKVSEQSRSTFCVEIKPKQGFLCRADKKFRKCPYCMLQYYKWETGAVSNRSRYCPFDLFSGDCDRMNRALESLLQNPQNNLKIFKDGVVVYDQESHASNLDSIFREWFPVVGEASSSREKHFNLFFSLIREALLREFSNDDQSTAQSRRSSMAFEISPNIEVPSRLSPEIVAKAKKMLYFINEECNFKSGNLPQSSVLNRILEMQGLHCCGTDVVSWVYSKFSLILNNEIIYSSLIDGYKSGESIRRSIPLAGCMNSLATSEQHDFMGTNVNEKLQESEENPLLLINRQISSGHHKEKFLERFTAEDKSIIEYFPIEEQILALQNYLLFCTAKDCSILIAFQELNPNESKNIPNDYVIEVSKVLKFVVSVRISDLDPKSFYSIEKHLRRDMETLNAVIQIIGKEMSLGKHSRDESLSVMD